MLNSCSAIRNNGWCKRIATPLYNKHCISEISNWNRSFWCLRSRPSLYFTNLLLISCHGNMFCSYCHIFFFDSPAGSTPPRVHLMHQIFVCVRVVWLYSGMIVQTENAKRKRNGKELIINCGHPDKFDLHRLCMRNDENSFVKILLSNVS